MKNLNYVASLVQIDLEDSTTHALKRILHYAILGYRDMKFKGDNRVRVKYVRPNAVWQAPLPPDYYQYTKIGLNYKGQWLTLTKNNNLFTHYDKTNECGEEVLDIFNRLQSGNGDFLAPYGYWYWAPHYRSGNFVGEMYSMTGGVSSIGQFKIDEEQGIIQFDPRYGSREYAMEYVSDGSDADGSTIIPTTAAEPLRQYVHWQLAEHAHPKLSPVERDEAWGNYNRALGEYREILYAPSIEEFEEALLQVYSSTAKR